MDKVVIACNRKGQPNYPKEFKHQIAVTACEPGISVAKLAMAHQLNVNMVFRRRGELRAREAEPAQASPALLLIVLERSSQTHPLKATGATTTAPNAIEIVIGDACVPIGGEPRPKADLQER